MVPVQDGYVVNVREAINQLDCPYLQPLSRWMVFCKRLQALCPMIHPESSATRCPIGKKPAWRRDSLAHLNGVLGKW